MGVGSARFGLQTSIRLREGARRGPHGAGGCAGVARPTSADLGAAWRVLRRDLGSRGVIVPPQERLQRGQPGDLARRTDRARAGCLRSDAAIGTPAPAPQPRLSRAIDDLGILAEALTGGYDGRAEHGPPRDSRWFRDRASGILIVRGCHPERGSDGRVLGSRARSRRPAPEEPSSAPSLMISRRLASYPLADERGLLVHAR